MASHQQASIAPAGCRFADHRSVRRRARGVAFGRSFSCYFGPSISSSRGLVVSHARHDSSAHGLARAAHCHAVPCSFVCSASASACEHSSRESWFEVACLSDLPTPQLVEPLQRLRERSRMLAFIRSWSASVVSRRFAGIADVCDPAVATCRSAFWRRGVSSLPGLLRAAA